MKKALSLILAALLLASSLAACGKTEPKETEKTATDPVATNAVETKAPETSTPETDAPTPAYATDKITENGAATAHIVVAEGADSLLGYAAEELVNHIKLVSGADVTVTNEAQSDSLPIIIATPDTNPELETLFADDLAWLRDTGDGEKVRFGDDGFAIRLLDNKLYIFGATARGALNGVYDFIEDNMGVLWIRATNTVENPIIYDGMPTISVTKADYREKSPFNLRGWTLAGNSMEHQIMLSRNKLNAFAITPAGYISAVNNGGYLYDDVGMAPFITNHNIIWWIVNSPSYDPSINEYWDTDTDGNHLSREESKQVNFWSELLMQCIADHVISFLDTYSSTAEIRYIGICLEDIAKPCVYPEMTEPFEYAPGQFVNPDAQNYLSTVYFTMLNNIAKIVGEKYPDVILHTYAYDHLITPPACDLEPNVYATICPINEDLLANFGESQGELAQLNDKAMLGWLEKTPNAQVYNYYGCFTLSPIFERPIWDRIQFDLQQYAANGFNGLVPEGTGDIVAGGAWGSGDWSDYSGARIPYYTYENIYNMNAMTYWIYHKLAWNPEEDVDALIQYYCEKVYGDAADEMLEFYRILEMAWDEGRQLMSGEFNRFYLFCSNADIYWLYFFDVELDEGYTLDLLREALHKAYDAADEKGKEHLKYKVEVIDNAETLFLD